MQLPSVIDFLHNWSEAESFSFVRLIGLALLENRGIAFFIVIIILLKTKWSRYCIGISHELMTEVIPRRCPFILLLSASPVDINED